MKITEDVLKYAAEQTITENEVLQRGMTEKSKEFMDSGTAISVKAQSSTTSPGKP